MKRIASPLWLIFAWHDLLGAMLAADITKPIRPHHPKIAAEMAQFMLSSHTPNEHYGWKAGPAKPKSVNGGVKFGQKGGAVRRGNVHRGAMEKGSLAFLRFLLRSRTPFPFLG